MKDTNVLVIAAAVAAGMGTIGSIWSSTDSQVAAIAVSLFLASRMLRSFMTQWRPSRVFSRPNENREIESRISRR